jgi:MFS family permease
LANEWLGFLVSRLVWGIWQGALLPVAYALIANTISITQQGFALGLGNSAAKAGALLGVVLGGIGMGLVGLAHSFWLVALTYAIAAIGIRWVRSLNSAPDRSTLSPHTYHN